MSRMARSRAGQSAEQLREQIRATGLRATSPRIAVLQSLGRSRTPVSHAELAAELAPKGWDRATIYRNLIDLTNAGLVRRTDMGDHLWRFELREGTGLEHLSMGMSADYEVAIEEGATMVRVGTSIFGPRRGPAGPEEKRA